MDFELLKRTTFVQSVHLQLTPQLTKNWFVKSCKTLLEAWLLVAWADVNVLLLVSTCKHPAGQLGFSSDLFVFFAIAAAAQYHSKTEPMLSSIHLWIVATVCWIQKSQMHRISSFRCWEGAHTLVHNLFLVAPVTMKLVWDPGQLWEAMRDRLTFMASHPAFIVILSSENTATTSTLSLCAATNNFLLWEEQPRKCAFTSFTAAAMNLALPGKEIFSEKKTQWMCVSARRQHMTRDVSDQNMTHLEQQ